MGPRVGLNLIERKVQSHTSAIISQTQKGLPDLFKQLVADMTLTDTSENALTSHLHCLIEKDDLDVLVLCEDDENFLQSFLPLGCPQVYLRILR